MIKLPLSFGIAIGVFVSASAAAEIAAPKNASPEEHLKLASPQLPQNDVVETSTSKEHTLSITKEETTGFDYPWPDSGIATKPCGGSGIVVTLIQKFATTRSFFGGLGRGYDGNASRELCLSGAAIS